MDKILIIGQAPPVVNQILPYDTTLLYDIFDWIGITKEQAQNLFDFDAVYNKFPGFDSNGNHLTPTQEQMEEYWYDTLLIKTGNYQKIIILGNVAKNFINEKLKYRDNILYLVHPSKRNYQRIITNVTRLCVRWRLELLNFKISTNES